MSNDALERIQQIDLFTDFKDDIEKINYIFSYTKKENYNAGKTIINEGDLGDKLFILSRGTVRILKKTLNNEKYTVTLSSADDNVFFGEVALIDSDRRSATVIAESDCEVYSIHRKNFLTMCEKDPFMGYKIILKIAKKIARTLRKMNKDVVILFEALVNEVKGEF